MSLSSGIVALSSGIVDANGWPTNCHVLLGSTRLRRNCVSSLVWNLTSLLCLAYIESISNGDLKRILTCLWVPVTCLSVYLNSQWNQKMADRCFDIFTGKPRQAQVHIAQDVYRNVLVAVYTVQASLVYFIPIVGPILSFSLFSLLTSLYAFEYTWIRQNWSLQKRIATLESRWLYFLAFGNFCTLGSWFGSILINQACWGALFPFYILFATRAKIPPKTKRVRFFGPSEFIASLILSLLSRMHSPVSSKSTTSTKSSHETTKPTKSTKSIQDHPTSKSAKSSKVDKKNQ